MLMLILAETSELFGLCRY